MKYVLITIASLVLVGCATTQQPKPTTAKTPEISIHDAIGKGNSEAVKQHLAAGTKVDVKHDDGWTPLQFAAGEGQKEIAELLRKHGGKTSEELKAPRY